MLTHKSRKLAQHLHGINIPAEITAGVLVAINIFFSCLSFSALILTTYLNDYIYFAFRLLLVSSILSTVLLLFLSKEPLAIGTTSNQIISIMVVLSSGIITSSAAVMSKPELLQIIFLIVAITTISSGLMFFLFGYMKLGGIIRYIPYPVTSGILAGSGWIICGGALELISGQSIAMNTLPNLLQTPVIYNILGVIAWSLLINALTKKFNHTGTLPISVLISIILFYILFFAFGISTAEAIKNGWLLSRDLINPSSLNINMFNSFSYQHDFPAIYEQLTTIVAMLFIAIISFLINMVGLEQINNRELNVDKELKTAGIINMIIGTSGGIVSFLSLSNATVAKNSHATSKLSVALSVAIMVLFLFFGMTYIIYFPKIILSCLLMFFGLSLLSNTFLINWLRLSLQDFILTLFIFIVIVCFGLIVGLFTGLILATILFAIKYSQVDVIYKTIPGKNIRSTMHYNNENYEILQAKRDEIIFLKLSGFIFFGTANQLLSNIKKNLSDEHTIMPKYVILDFSLVTDLDASALMMFTKLNLLSTQFHVTFILTVISKKIIDNLRQWNILQEDFNLIRYFENNDLAIEWCERKILKQIHTQQETKKHSFVAMFPDLNPKQIQQLFSYFTPVALAENTTLFNQNDESHSLYYIHSGEIAISLKKRDGKIERLSKIGPGNIFGEMGLYNQHKRIASATTVVSSILYELSREAFLEMRLYDPKLARALDKLIIEFLSERLAFMDKKIRQLL